ncbi:MAG: arginine--tRNA ligase [Patescibacteria group bacterium]
MKIQLQHLFQDLLNDMGIDDVVVDVVMTENATNGDYTTNIAMKLANVLKRSPMDIALQVKKEVESLKLKVESKGEDLNKAKDNQNISSIATHKDILQAIDHIEVVTPGFINIFLTEASLSNSVSEVLKLKESYGTSSLKEVKTIMVEFAHPNTHKAFHIGHLRNITTGECVVRLLEATGHTIIRANYQGDVGMHIAKALYGLMNVSEFADQVESMRVKEIHEKVEFLGKAYAAGSAAFEASDEAKVAIKDINIKIYAKDESVYPLYKETRQWSLDYFEAIYKRVGTHYDRYYFEGEVYETGKKYVLEGLEKGIFEKSEGAIIFAGEKVGLHNRVFISSEGNPTYEGKDMGLGRLQFDEYHLDLVLHVLGPEQYGYTRVMFEALAQLFPDTRDKQYHLVYGWVNLKSGKMSSRSGNVVLGEWLLDEAKKEIKNILSTNRSNYTEVDQKDIAEKAAVAAVKYAFLRVSINQEIAFDLNNSVSFEGDSGPYLLYTYARCKSVLIKSQSPILNTQQGSWKLDIGDWLLNPEERLLARYIHFYPQIVADTASSFSPSILCKYLFELASAFNSFYAKHKIGESASRLQLTEAVSQILKNGLYLLGITTVEKM